MHCKLDQYILVWSDFDKDTSHWKKGFVMKNNRWYNCGLQLWVSLIFIVFRETELILCVQRNLSPLLNEKKALQKAATRKVWNNLRSCWPEQGEELIMEQVWVNLHLLFCILSVYCTFLFSNWKIYIAISKRGTEKLWEWELTCNWLTRTDLQRKERRQQLFFPSIPMLAN